MLIAPTLFTESAWADNMNNDIVRLLEKSWNDLRHVETERHWILTAYAVIVAGVLSLIVEPGNSDTTNGFSYLLLAILGVIGGLHSFRAAYHWEYHIQHRFGTIWDSLPQDFSPKTLSGDSELPQRPLSWGASGSRR